MKGQERFETELARLESYCQEVMGSLKKESEMSNVKEACLNLRSLMGRLLSIADEMDEGSPGIANSEEETSENGDALFDYIHTFRRGNAYYDLLNFKEAIHELRRVLDESTDPHVIASAYNGLGHIYAVKKMYIQAIYYFSKVVEFYPEDSDGYFNLGAAYFNLGDYQEAKRHFQQSLCHHPDDWEGYFNLGRTYEKLGEMESAVFYMKKAREIKYSSIADTASFR